MGKIPMEIENDGLHAAFDISAEGIATPLGWDDLDGPVPEGGWRWIHLHRDAARTQEWLLDGEVPPDAVAWALMAEDTRPRFTVLDGGDVLFLRGVNLNEGEEPEDMISLRTSISRTHVITVAMRRLSSIETLKARFESASPGLGRVEIAGSTGEFLVALVQQLRWRLEPILDELEDVIFENEISALTMRGVPTAAMRGAFTDARQDAVMLRRYLVPQAHALREVVLRRPVWLSDAEMLMEEADAYQRACEDLESLRERAAVLREEMSTRLSERANDIVLVLSAVSAVFLPLTFVTGLMGMNVGGLPLAESPRGFWIISGVMALSGLVTLLLLWRLWRRS